MAFHKNWMDAQADLSSLRANVILLVLSFSGLFRKLTKLSNDQELIQSDPISCPKNQKGNKKEKCINIKYASKQKRGSIKSVLHALWPTTASFIKCKVSENPNVLIYDQDSKCIASSISFLTFGFGLVGNHGNLRALPMKICWMSQKF